MIFRGFLLEYLNFYSSYLLSLACVLRGEVDICLASFSTSLSWDLGLSSLFLLTKGPAGSSIPQQRVSAWEDCRFPASRLVIRMQICSQGKCCGMSSHLLPWQSPSPESWPASLHGFSSSLIPQNRFKIFIQLL